MDILTSKAPTEAVPITFDFASQLADGELISGTPTVAVTTMFGYDASPSARLVGPATSSDGVVQQLFSGGVLGEHYVITCQVTTNNSQTLVLKSLLPIRDPQDA